MKIDFIYLYLHVFLILRRNLVCVETTFLDILGGTLVCLSFHTISIGGSLVCVSDWSFQVILNVLEEVWYARKIMHFRPKEEVSCAGGLSPFMPFSHQRS